MVSGEERVSGWSGSERIPKGDEFLERSGSEGIPEVDEFPEWSGSEGIPEQAVLFCYGDPGVGKTHIRSVRKLSPIGGHY